MTKYRRKCALRRGACCATLNVTEEERELRRIIGCCAIIDVTEGKGAFDYGDSIEERVFGANQGAVQAGM